MYASKLDWMRASRTGRLIEYDPKTDETKVLARNLWFSNGISIDKDEQFIIFAETFAMRLLKLYLNGPQQGTIEVLVDSYDMTGYPDGVDCAWKGLSGKLKKTQQHKCFTVLPSAVVPIAKILNYIPYPIDMIVRTLLMALPRSIAPKVKPYGGILEVDYETKEMQYIQDPDATDIGMLTGVTVWNDKLYLGSLQNDFIGVYDLN